MGEHVIVAAQTDTSQGASKDVASVVDTSDSKVQIYVRARLEVWNTGTLAWDKMTQPGGGSGGAVTVADGADVTQGAIADAAVSTDATGTVNAHLRGVVKLLAAGINVAFAAAQHVIVDSTSSTVDVSDRAGRLVGVVSAANLDVALSTRLKPADTLTAVTTVGTITNPVDVSDRAARLLGVQMEQRAATLHVTVTAAVNTAATATLPAAGAGLFHYITSIQIVKLYSVVGVAAGAGVIITSTNLPGNPAWTTEQLASVAGTAVTVLDYKPTTPLKSSVANTATTIVCPVQLQTIWRVNVSYFTAA